LGFLSIFGEQGNEDKMKTIKNTVFGLAAVLATVGSMGCAVGSMEADKLCVTKHSLSFPGTTLFEGVETPPVTQKFDFDVSEALTKYSLGPSAEMEAEVTLESVTLIAKQGIKDFNFISTLSFKIAADPKNPGADALDPIEVVNYRRVEGSAPLSSSSLELPSTTQENIHPYLKLGKNYVTVRASGFVPTDDWAIDVTICFHPKVAAAL